MICFRKTIHHFPHGWRQILLKTMATYGIQTRNGIFCLSKKTNGSGTIQCPEISHKNIELLIPQTRENMFNKLNSLRLLNQACQLNGISRLKGFYVDGCEFEKAICINDTGTEALDKLDINSFDRVQFEWNGENHVVRHASVNDSVGDEYTLREFDMYHPIVDSHEYKPVYSSYAQVLPSLQLIAEHNKSLSLSQHIQSINKQTLHNKHELKHPFIVVEGLDGTGKSTLSKNLANYMDGVAMGTPPPSISEIRKHFDNFPELYRRSYYALGNYIAAQEVLEHCKTKAVVMDRFWHSTTSYAISSEVGCGTTEYIPPEGHEIYSWPNDLLYPSAVVFLTTKERDRDLRVNERDEQTDEEKYISVSRTFRARIIETYRRIGHSKWMEVDTSGTQEETLAKVVSALKLHGVI